MSAKSNFASPSSAPYFRPSLKPLAIPADTTSAKTCPMIHRSLQPLQEESLSTALPELDQSFRPPQLSSGG
ncbi:hypothetical protein Tco_0623708, partial [Tanacetum coccineum]